MNKQWVETRKSERLKEAQVERSKMIKMIDDTIVLSDEDKRMLISAIDTECGKNSHVLDCSIMMKIYELHDEDKEESVSPFKIRDFISCLDIQNYNWLLYEAKSDWLDRYLDSDPIEFDGDIIITDPCYIMRSEHHGTIPLTEDDWDACDYGNNMGVLGINKYLTKDTIYGDWGCTVFDTDSRSPIGDFCADAGLVSVFLLDEVLKYNPDFDYHKERPWTTALIPNFKGTVQIVIEHIEGVYEEDSEYHSAGDTWEDFEVHVVGHGINSKTGEHINFRSSQTSL